jgi:hypothetical protein
VKLGVQLGRDMFLSIMDLVVLWRSFLEQFPLRIVHYIITDRGGTKMFSTGSKPYFGSGRTHESFPPASLNGLPYRYSTGSERGTGYPEIWFLQRR